MKKQTYLLNIDIGSNSIPIAICLVKIYPFLTNSSPFGGDLAHVAVVETRRLGPYA